MTIEKALSKVSELFKKAGIKGFQQESVMILSYVLKRPIEFIYTHYEEKISDKNFDKILKMAEKRANGMPMAYILGKKEFYGLEFKVNSKVLIPRPETEMIVNETLDWIKSFKKDKNLLILDIGTGSGCIPIAIAKNIERENVKFIATDISEDALKIAKKNASIDKVNNRISFIKSDLFENLDRKIFNKENILIIANLPYLSKKIYNNCNISVKNFEPKEALLSGDDGLDHYRELFDEINLVMSKLKRSEKDDWIPASAGMTSLSVLLEISPEQKELIEKLIKEKFSNQVEVSVKKDLAGKWRMVRIKL